MDITISSPIAGSRLATVSGELDADNCNEFGAQMLDDLDDVSAITLDLWQVSFLDSSALSELLRIKGELDRADISFTMSSVSDQVRRVLEITGLMDTFRIS